MFGLFSRRRSYGPLHPNPRVKRKRRVREPIVIRTKVVGVTFRNEDGSKRQKIVARCNPGDELILKHEPVEDYPFALAVHNRKGQQLGYLRDELAKDIVGYMEEGRHVQCRVLEVTGGGWGRSVGCNIEVIIE